MLKTPYTSQHYTAYSKLISNALVLRPPQKESLERFARICDLLSLSKQPDLDEELAIIRQHYPTLSSFERSFPSFCFALATGIGKTRLMGAMIAYLHYEKGVNNFFVMAPNLTIYRKLKSDLSDTNSPKYVFRGLDKFTSAPRIVDGDNYEDFRQISLETQINKVTINVFNISKLNSESGRMRRIGEVLGQSYFDYLKNLPDLCIFMDESHHYHADRGFDTINELQPILGVELTATPQVQRGARKVDFQNVVYEYSLAHALKDGLYVKVPVVVTRRNFNSSEYDAQQLDREKLVDGIRMHEETKSQLDIYGRTFGKPIVKPFVLVVAKDTAHSKEIREFLSSDSFYNGEYKDKVLEINSGQRGMEKDENIEKLISLENPNNPIEVVIHVNMLKEGWDVTNLYTIVPLRASASETLTEQTIGRGLRLPYGQRTGDEAADRLSIVSHDRYQDIINLANDPNSLVRKMYVIDDQEQEPDQPKEVIGASSAYDEATSSPQFVEQIALVIQGSASTQSPVFSSSTKAELLANFVAKKTASTVYDLNRSVASFDAVKSQEARMVVMDAVIEQTILQHPDLLLTKEDLLPAVEQAFESCIQALTAHVIPIPIAVIQPFAKVEQGFKTFTLDTRNLRWHPGDDTLQGTELQEDGRTYDIIADTARIKQRDTPVNEVARHIIAADHIDYQSNADLIFSLIQDAKAHFLTYLSEEETDALMRARQKGLAQFILLQMNQHFYKEDTGYRGSKVRPFSRIEMSYFSKLRADEVLDLRASLPAGEVKYKVFSGTKKAGHTLNKFDSDTERRLAIVLEDDSEVLHWLRPSPKQFSIYYGKGSTRRYEPDFVVETAQGIFMVETKATRDLNDVDVLEKAKAGQEYCRVVTEWNQENGGKPWRYVLIAHDAVNWNATFEYLVGNSTRLEQMSAFP